MISKELWGIIIGGLLPAVLWALSSVFAKYGNLAGIGNALYVITLGIAVFISGLILYLFVPDRTVSYRGIVYTAIAGACWAFGTALFALALTKYGIPLSKLVPLNNTSTLFAIIIGLWAFSEWQQVNSIRLIFGASLILFGSIIVSKS